MRRIAIAGVSTRAAAGSAARAGFDVTAIDAFADVDQHPSVRAVSIPRPFTPGAAARAARRVDCDAAAYLSNFENYPDAVRLLAADRALWGNSPDVLRCVRDPVRLSRALRARGIATPAVQVQPEVTGGRNKRATAADRHWLVKPLASGGGHAVRRWHGERVEDNCYLQEMIPGTPGSMAFVAAGGRAVLLGISRQLIGERAFGGTGYRYCGNILTPPADDALVDAACAIACAVSEEFGLVGVNGIDFIAGDTGPYAVEVNPRWCASMELMERAYGISVFAAHVAACTGGTLPEFDLRRAQPDAGALGKAIIFARDDVTVGDTSGWLADADVRDIPHSSEQIRAGRPVCTVFASGRNEAECYGALVQRAERVYAELDAWNC